MDSAVILEVAALVVLGLVVVSGFMQLREEAADKVAAITPYLDRSVDIVMVRGWRVLFEVDVEGTIEHVDSRGVMVRQRDGKDRYVLLHDIRALEDRTGAEIASWR